MSRESLVSAVMQAIELFDRSKGSVVVTECEDGTFETSLVVDLGTGTCGPGKHREVWRIIGLDDILSEGEITDYDLRELAEFVATQLEREMIYLDTEDDESGWH